MLGEVIDAVLSVMIRAERFYYFSITIDILSNIHDMKCFTILDTHSINDVHKVDF